MRYFFCKLIPPRPAFPADATESELEVMKQHSLYWRAKLEQRKAVSYGPVRDPSGNYGVGIIEVEDETEAKEFMESDPVNQIGFRIEVHPMAAAIVRS